MEDYEKVFLYGTFIGLIILTSAIGNMIKTLGDHIVLFRKASDVFHAIKDELTVLSDIIKVQNKQIDLHLQLIEKLDKELSDIKSNVGNMADKELNKNIPEKELKQ